MIFGLGSLGSKLILFILVPLYTNYLTTAEYGVAEMVFTVAQLLIPVASMTVWNGLIRFGLMNGQKPENVFKNSILIWISGSVLIICATPLLALYSPISQWRWYLCGYSIAYIAAQVELNYLKVKNRNRLFALVSVLQTLFLALLNIVLLVLFRTGVRGYLLSNIIAHCATVILTFALGGLHRDLRLGHYDRELLRQLIVYSAPLIMNDISWWFIHSSDKVMIEWMLSEEELGLYTVASKIPALINTFVNIFAQAWGISSIKEIESTNDLSYYSQVFKVYSMLSFGASVAFIAITKPFMTLYVGKDFITAWRYVPLLLLAASFSAISAYYGSMFGALKKSVECMWSTLIGAIANVLLNYVFIRFIGTWGAIVGTVCAFFVIATVRLFWVNHYIRMKLYWRYLIIDIFITLTEGILISMNWHIVFVSVSAFLAFTLNHLDNFHGIQNFLSPRN